MEFSIAIDHPALPGHFPGQPVVPGVLLLSEAIRVLEQERTEALHITGISSAKFLGMVLPGQQVTVDAPLPKPGDTLIRVKLIRDGEAVCSAQLKITPSANPG